jgi:hypothetical protein
VRVLRSHRQSADELETITLRMVCAFESMLSAGSRVTVGHGEHPVASGVERKGKNEPRLQRPCKSYRMGTQFGQSRSSNMRAMLLKIQSQESNLGIESECMEENYPANVSPTSNERSGIRRPLLRMIFITRYLNFRGNLGLENLKLKLRWVKCTPTMHDSRRGCRRKRCTAYVS